MQLAVHAFHDLESAGFRLRDYSELKFGSDRAAKTLGYELAEKVYKDLYEVLTTRRCVVIPSAYNVVEIAATIMARHFYNRLNDLLSRDGHQHVEWTTMHRSMSYVQDYSYMTAEDRKRLLAGDQLYINQQFIAGKTLLFVDDVTITGTHEQKIEAFLKSINIDNPRVFLYYAQYLGTQANIEAKLNHSGIKDIADYISLVEQPNHHLVVRAVRFLLDVPTDQLKLALEHLKPSFVEKLYFACLAKEYNQINSYQEGFNLIRAKHDASAKV